MDSNNDEALTMSNRFLSDEDKLIILIIASILFLITLLITVCFVSPCCWPHQWLTRNSLMAEPKAALPTGKPGKQRQVLLESKNFQLTVQPQFIAKQSLNRSTDNESRLIGTDMANAESVDQSASAMTTTMITSGLFTDNKTSRDNKLINLYRPETEQELKMQKKVLKEIFKRKEINDNPFTINHKELIDYDYYASRNFSTKSKVSLLVEESLYDESNAEIAMNVQIESVDTVVDGNAAAGWMGHGSPIDASSTNRLFGNDSNDGGESFVRLIVTVPGLHNLKPNSCGPELIMYLTITAQPISSHFRKSSSRKLNNRLNACVRYESDTFKVRPDRACVSAYYRSESIPKSILKDTKLKVRLMQATRYANDRCLGELSLNLKQFMNESQSIDSSNNLLTNDSMAVQSVESSQPIKCYKLNKPKDVRILFYLFNQLKRLIQLCNRFNLLFR